MKHARTDYDERIQDSAGLIPADEPVMLVRGQDVCAVPTIDAWIEAAMMARVDEALIAAAERHRGRIETWQAEHGAKAPDAPLAALDTPETPS